MIDMEKFKGTKGEWVVLPDNEHEEICQIWTKEESNSLPVYVARTCFAPASNANARLIATAPELLDALQDLVKMIRVMDVDLIDTSYANLVMSKALGL